MLKFYLTRLEALPEDERQGYLDNTVAASMRDKVRDAYNEDHEDKLK